MSAEQLRAPGDQQIPIGGDLPSSLLPDTIVALYSDRVRDGRTVVPQRSVIFLLPVQPTYIVDYGIPPQTDSTDDFVHELRQSAKAHNYGEPPWSSRRIHRTVDHIGHSVTQFLGESATTLASLPQAVQDTSLSVAEYLRDRLNIALDIDVVTGQGLTTDGTVLPSRFATLPERSRRLIRSVFKMEQDIEVGNPEPSRHDTTVVFVREGKPVGERVNNLLNAVGEFGNEVANSFGIYLAEHPGEALYSDLSQRADQALISALEAVGDEARLIYVNWKLHPIRNTAFAASPALVISCAPFLQVPPTPIPSGSDGQADSSCSPSSAESQDIRTTRDQLERRATELSSLLGQPGAVDYQRQSDDSIVAFFKTVSEGSSGSEATMIPGFRVTRESSENGGRTCYYIIDSNGDEFFWGERELPAFDVFARQISNPMMTPPPKTAESVAEPSVTASSEPPATEQNPTAPPPDTEAPTEALPTQPPTPKPPTSELASPTPDNFPTPTEDVIELLVTPKPPILTPKPPTREATPIPRLPELKQNGWTYEVEGKPVILRGAVLPHLTTNLELDPTQSQDCIKDIERLKELGINSVSIYWNLGEVSNPKYVDGLLKVVQEAQRNGMRVIFAPHSNGFDENNPFSGKHMLRPPPDYMQRWEMLFDYPGAMDILASGVDVISLVAEYGEQTPWSDWRNESLDYTSRMRERFKSVGKEMQFAVSLPEFASNPTGVLENPITDPDVGIDFHPYPWVWDKYAGTPNSPDEFVRAMRAQNRMVILGEMGPMYDQPFEASVEKVLRTLKLMTEFQMNGMWFAAWTEQDGSGHLFKRRGVVSKAGELVFPYLTP